MRALIYVNIIKEVAHAHVQNTPLELFSSTTGLAAVERDLLVVHPVIDIRGLPYKILAFSGLVRLLLFFFGPLSLAVRCCWFQTMM